MTDRIDLGDISIEKEDNGIIWITLKTGEAMTLTRESRDALGQIIQKFFYEVF